MDWLFTSEINHASLPPPTPPFPCRTAALMSGGPWSPASQLAAASAMATGPSATASVAMSTTTAARWGLRRRPIYTRPRPPPSTRGSAARRSWCARWKLSLGTNADLLRFCNVKSWRCVLFSLLFLSLNAPSLLKEAEIYAEQREFELNRRRQMGLSASHHSLDNIEFDNKEDDQHDQRLLSQFGIWFLVCVSSKGGRGDHK